MDSLIGQVEEERPSPGVVTPHYLDRLPGDQICGVSAPGPVVSCSVPPEVQVASSLVVEVGLGPGVESNKTIEPPLCRGEGLLAEAEVPLPHHVSVVAQPLQLVGQQASLQAQPCGLQWLRRLSLNHF